MSFAGKVVLVTGGSSGIGADAAIHLSKLGASVAIVSIDPKNLNIVAQKIISAGSPKPLEITADVTKDAERIISQTIEHFGKLNVLVNNAGIAELSQEPLGTVDMYDRIMNTNVRSVLVLTKLAAPHLAKTKGNVINISSIAGTIVVTHGTAYAMSKAAIDHFTRCAAIELAPLDIRVNAVSPGAIETPILQTFCADVDKFVEGCKGSYPLRRIGQVNDTSEAIAFLASDAASFITGHLLTVDGGKTLAK